MSETLIDHLATRAGTCRLITGTEAGRTNQPLVTTLPQKWGGAIFQQPYSSKCRRCGQPFTICTHAKGWRPKPGRSYFSWWWRCDNSACPTTLVMPPNVAQSTQAPSETELFDVNNANAVDNFCMTVLRECQQDDFPPEHVTNGAVTGAALTGSDSDPGGVTDGAKSAGQCPVGHKQVL